MSWGIAQCWLAVLGVLLVTFGTGAQAWANLAEFERLKASVSEDAWNAVKATLGEAAVHALLLSAGLPSALRVWGTSVRLFRLLVARTSIQWAIIVIRRRLAQIRDKGGDQAVEMARFIRAAQAWAILMLASGIALVSAVIELALAYE